MNLRADGDETAAAPLDARTWSARPLAAWGVRLAQAVLPFIAGWVAIRSTQTYFLATDDGRWIELLVWLPQAIVVATATSMLVARFLRRFTPLVALLQMSLVFPDHVPSRFGLALRSGTVKKLLAAPTVRLSDSIQEAAEQAVQLVIHLTDHEPLTRGHSERVRAYADVIGQQMGLSEDDLNGLRWGALLHDVGKLAVPAAILTKSGRPTEEEWEVLVGHPGEAAELLEPLRPWLGDWLLASAEHHERWDGTGYPAGLERDAISLAGRITAVADAYDVMTSRRSYSSPRSAEEAKRELVDSSGSHFDPAVVRAMLDAGVDRVSRAGQFGWILELPRAGRLIETAGQAATAAFVAVVAVAATAGPLIAGADGITLSDTALSDGPALPDTVLSDGPAFPDDLAFVEPADTASGQGPVEPSPAEAGAPASTTAVDTSAAPGGSETTVVPSTTTTSAPPSTTGPTTTAPPSTAPSTDLPATTATTAPTTTTSPTTHCDAILAGETDLVGADLRGCDLRTLSASGLNLQDARLDGVDLSGAVITDFNLAGAVLTDAVLTGTELRRGSSVGASFRNASARGLVVDAVDLAYTDLRDADLGEANLSSVSFGFADLRGANLSGSAIVGTNFNDADASSTSFGSIDLTGAEFYRTKLQGADLANTNLSGAVFSGSTGVPVGTGSALFSGTTCPNSSFGDVNCW